jgi:hypothetical protein
VTRFWILELATAFGILPAGGLLDVADGAFMPPWHKSPYRIGDPNEAGRVRVDLGIIREDSAYERFSGITRPALAVPRDEEFAEPFFGLLAIASARAALAAATAFCPADVITSTLVDEAEARSLVSTRHGVTVWFAMNSLIASSEMMTFFLPTGPNAIRRWLTRARAAF